MGRYGLKKNGVDGPSIVYMHDTRIVLFDVTVELVRFTIQSYESQTKSSVSLFSSLMDVWYELCVNKVSSWSAGGATGMASVSAFSTLSPQVLRQLDATSKLTTSMHRQR